MVPNVHACQPEFGGLGKRLVPLALLVDAPCGGSRGWQAAGRGEHDDDRFESAVRCVGMMIRFF